MLSERRGRATPAPTLWLVLVLALLVSAPAGATAPGRNGKLIYERPVGRLGSDLFSVAPDGSGRARIFGTARPESQAEWSPDGTRIVFTREVRSRGPWEIFAANADGSGVRRLTRHRAYSIAPSWSPDGTRIAYVTDKDGVRTRSGSDPALQLYVMKADGSRKRRLTRSRAQASDPTWSPDSRRIAYLGFRAGPRFDGNIAVIGAKGRWRRRLTRAGGGDELNPNWSPDGRTIVYETTRSFDRRQSDIAVMNADGSGKRRLTRSAVFETNPVWSPDGQRIAFTSDRDNRARSRTRLRRGFELYTMAPDGTGVFRVTRNRVSDLFPDWQPLP
jgi:Tol biopolymer transport system component